MDDPSTAVAPDTGLGLSGALPSWIGSTFMYAAFGLLAVVLLFGFLYTLATKNTGLKTSGKVVGLVGRPGAGKTYAAIKMALERLQGGVDVVSNFHIDTTGLKITGKWSGFQGWEQIAELRDCVVIIDEAHLYASSHAHINFPMIARWAMSQCRHNGLDVYWISQHEDRVNKTLRAITGLIGVCENWFGGRYFRVTYYEPENLRKPKKHLYKATYKFDINIAKRYDTRATVVVDEYSLKNDASADALRRATARHLAAHEGVGAGGAPTPEAPAGYVPPRATTTGAYRFQ